MTGPLSAPVYVFGIVPAGTSLPGPGNDELSADLRLVEHNTLAAVTGSLPTQRTLGRASDLLAHDRVLNGLLAHGVPVLPMCFGAVMTDEAAVEQELLSANYDEFVAGLVTVSGRAQYAVQVEYDEIVALREAAANDPRIAPLREAAQRPDARPDQQLRLGEYVVRAIEQRRPADTSAVLGWLSDFGEVHERELPTPLHVLDAAFLIADEDVDRFVAAVEDLARRQAERLQVRLVGPSPAYDFVGSH